MPIDPRRPRSQFARHPLGAILLLSLFAAACSDEVTPTDQSADATDTAEEIAEDTGDESGQDTAGEDAEVEPDVETDTGTDAGPDGFDPSLREHLTGDACEDQWDCDENWVCAAGVCNRFPYCGAASNWTKCVDLINEVEPGLGYRAACIEGFCHALCETDSHCPSSELCTDYGVCVPFEDSVTDWVAGDGEPGTLQAGFGETLMNFPIGTPLAGYGHRAAFDEGRYAQSLQPSAGQLHGLFVRALYLDNGDSELLVLRAPFIFPSMAIHELVARALEEETGRDWRDSLVISATHTHSGPGRFWHVPSDAALSVGALGIGEFSQEIYAWLIESFIEAAVAAIADAEPARLGWDIVEAYDTDDHIGRDRWPETPPFDDNRALLVRIDDAEGVPKAVLFSFGAHATDNSENYLSGDVHYGAEREIEHALGRDYGRFVPAMYMNQNSGSMSPGAGAQGHRFPQSVERYGARFVEKVYDELIAIETSAEVSLASRTHRFPISYELLDYGSGEFEGIAPLPMGGTYRKGGIQCWAREGWGDENYETFGEGDKLTCLALHFMLHNRSPSVFTRSQITAIDLAGLTVLTMPGELSMELSWEVLRQLRDDFEVDPLAAWTWGYAQDHLLYLVPTNMRGELPPFPGISTPQAPDDYPDFAFSYLQGGYEPGMSPWGPRLGDFLIRRATEAFGTLHDPDYEVALPSVYPSQFTLVEQEPFGIEEDDPDAVGTVVMEVPESVQRLDTIEFAWVGGDPGAEQPQAPLVVLERQADGGEFEELMLPNHRRYDNRAFRFMTRLRLGEESGWEWAIRWEELKDFPAGTYRFRVEGHYWSEGERSPYTLTSAAFELLPAEDGVITASAHASAVCGTAGYPAAGWMLYADDFDDPGLVDGNYRMHHYMVPTGASDPMVSDDDLTADGFSLTLRQGETVVADEDDVTIELATNPEAVSGRSNVPVSRYCLRFSEALAAGSYTADVAVTDLHGNSGTASVDFTVE